MVGDLEPAFNYPARIQALDTVDLLGCPAVSISRRGIVVPQTI